MNESDHRGSTGLGLKVIIALAVLTAIEFWVAVAMGTGVNLVLTVIAIIKALLIVEYFMHYSQLWNRPEDRG